MFQLSGVHYMSLEHLQTLHKLRRSLEGVMVDKDSILADAGASLLSVYVPGNALAPSLARDSRLGYSKAPCTQTVYTLAPM